MQLSVSAGGTPASVRKDIQSSLEQQLGARAISPGDPELAEALRINIDRQLVGVADGAQVSVSASVYVAVSKPMAETTAAAEVPDPAAAVEAKKSAKT